MEIACVLLLLALVGMANAVYFALLAYHLLPPDSRFVPAVCRMEAGACASVVFTRYGRLFGVPNSLPGIGFYLLLLLTAAGRILTGRWILPEAALAGAICTVLIGAYLVYALRVRLKARCPLCMLAHAINLLAAALLAGVVGSLDR